MKWSGRRWRSLYTDRASSTISPSFTWFQCGFLVLAESRVFRSLKVSMDDRMEGIPTHDLMLELSVGTLPVGASTEASGFATDCFSDGTIGFGNCF
ncbi:MAG: hypothetical protein ACLRIT_10325 [Blautia sp.]